MPWKKLWLLFTVIWVVVSGLNAGTILAFSEEHEKAWRPIVLGVLVPLVLYAIGWGWEWVRRKRRPSAPAE